MGFLVMRVKAVCYLLLYVTCLMFSIINVAAVPHAMQVIGMGYAAIGGVLAMNALRNSFYYQEETCILETLQHVIGERRLQYNKDIAIARDLGLSVFEPRFLTQDRLHTFLLNCGEERKLAGKAYERIVEQIAYTGCVSSNTESDWCEQFYNIENTLIPSMWARRYQHHYSQWDSAKSFFLKGAAWYFMPYLPAVLQTFGLVVFAANGNSFDALAVSGLVMYKCHQWISEFMSLYNELVMATRIAVVASLNAKNM